MNKVRKMLFVLAITSACLVGFENTPTAEAFGTPDPTPGAMLMGWFDIGAEPGDTDNVLPVIVNMSTELLGLPGTSSPYRVHLIFWDVNSNHVWDKNLRLSPWDVWSDASIRDIIENTIGDGMAAPQREQVTEKVMIDGVEVKRLSRLLDRHGRNPVRRILQAGSAQLPSFILQYSRRLGLCGRPSRRPYGRLPHGVR